MANESMARKILEDWLSRGNDVSDTGLPRHPEFIYRKQNKWKGWDAFLGTGTTENVPRDRTEDRAWELYTIEHI